MRSRWAIKTSIDVTIPAIRRVEFARVTNLQGQVKRLNSNKTKLVTFNSVPVTDVYTLDTLRELSDR